MHRYHCFETAHGIVAIAWNGNGITALRLPSASAAEAERAIRFPVQPVNRECVPP